VIQLIGVKIQRLNGENIIQQQKLTTQKTFITKSEMEKYRKLKEMKLQYKQNLQGDHEVRISVILNYREL
jgi:hypothetical protein